MTEEGIEPNHVVHVYFELSQYILANGYDRKGEKSLVGKNTDCEAEFLGLRTRSTIY